LKRGARLSVSVRPVLHRQHVANSRQHGGFLLKRTPIFNEPDTEHQIANIQKPASLKKPKQH
jgi:hypothetical protein